MSLIICKNKIFFKQIKKFKDYILKDIMSNFLEIYFNKLQLEIIVWIKLMLHRILDGYFVIMNNLYKRYLGHFIDYWC